MRGGPLHNLLVDRLADCAQEHGLLSETEVYVGPAVGFVDLVLTSQDGSLLIEVELTADRVTRDLEKAAALQLPLWIVAPNRRAASSIQRAVSAAHRSGMRTTTPILVHRFPEALQAITRLRAIPDRLQ